jgi:hypothetical protein
VRLGEPHVGRATRFAREASQRFVARDAAGAQVHDRLEDHLQGVGVVEHVADLLAGLVVAGEPRLAAGSCEARVLETRVVQLRAALAVALGFVHRQIGAAQQFLDAAVAAGAEHHPDARRHRGPLLADLERLRQRGEQPLARPHDHVRTGHALQQDPELVTAEPRGGVARAQARRDPPRHELEEPVALRVAASVVHRLEVVQVEEQHRELRVRARAARERVLDPVVEQRAVGEARQGVVERAMAQLLLERLAVVDVARGQHDAAHARVVEQVRRDRGDVAIRAVGVAHPPLPLLGVADRLGGQRGQERRHGRGVLRMHALEQ